MNGFGSIEECGILLNIIKEEEYMTNIPGNYQKMKEAFPELIASYESSGNIARKAGPLDEKTGHLVQLAASAAAGSEGGVHSHAKRALKAGASKEEVLHAVALLINTIGFPSTAAAFSWVSDVID